MDICLCVVIDTPSPLEILQSSLGESVYVLVGLGHVLLSVPRKREIQELIVDDPANGGLHLPVHSLRGPSLYETQPSAEHPLGEVRVSWLLNRSPIHEAQQCLCVDRHFR